VRAGYLARAYADLTADAVRLAATVELLRPMHPGEVIAEWQALAGAGAFLGLADGLMARHYDPRYDKHRARMGAKLVEVPVEDLSPAALPKVAARVAEAVRGLIGR